MKSSPEYDLNTVTWHKSTYSDASGGNCLEIAPREGGIPVRDSKDPDGPKLLFRPAAWSAFIANLKE
ncbi:DUF397 domain-containing protein [Streptomyces spectabilis]|uniref:DUF397 domain-containing protein n=1 Tax=Streptomyces spectabilis TaxID=68270 RepID=UPI0033FEF275